jgi:hypothetical protein
MVLLDLMLSDAAILPRPPRVDQSTERHSRAGMNDRSRDSGKKRRASAAIKKAPLTSRGLFPVLKPVPD